MSVIVMGGTHHIVGNKTQYHVERFSKWFSNDPARAVEEAIGDHGLDTIRTRKELLQLLVKNFNLSASCVQFLGFLHETIVQLWLKKIDEWLKKHPGQMEVTEIVESHPANYTEGMSRLKNMRFSGYDHEAIKGFCPFEPLARLDQLLQFPIEKFGDADELVAVEFDDHPDWPIGIVTMRTPSDLEREIVALQYELGRWEQYYDSISRCVTELCTKIESQKI